MVGSDQQVVVVLVAAAAAFAEQDLVAVSPEALLAVAVVQLEPVVPVGLVDIAADLALAADTAEDNIAAAGSTVHVGNRTYYLEAVAYIVVVAALLVDSFD